MRGAAGDAMRRRPTGNSRRRAYCEGQQETAMKPTLSTVAAVTTTVLLTLGLGLGAGSAPAAPPDKLSAVAGPQPSETQAQRAVLAELVRTRENPTDVSRVRFMSGPHLVTGVNFAGSREQAWEMCVVVGDAKLSRRTAAADLGLQPYFLRTQADQITVMKFANWKESDSVC